MGIVFSETEARPVGRKARIVSDELWAMLADGAKRDISKVAEGTEQEIADLVKDLGSASVRKRYTLTVETAKVDTGGLRLTFYAVAKPEAEGEPSSPAEPAAESSSPAAETGSPTGLGQGATEPSSPAEHRQGRHR